MEDIKYEDIPDNGKQLLALQDINENNYNFELLDSTVKEIIQELVNPSDDGPIMPSTQYDWKTLSNPNRQNGSKVIGRNTKCPCGSDKKFKHCCIE